MPFRFKHPQLHHRPRHRPPPWFREGDDAPEGEPRPPSPVPPWFPPHHTPPMMHHPFATTWRKRRAPLFIRLLVAFGLIVPLFLFGVFALSLFVARLMGREPHDGSLRWVLGLALLVLLVLLIARMASRAFRGIATPLAGIMAAADAVAEGDLSVRVPDGGPGEFGRLANSFNHMVQELERSDQQRRNLTADVAHELRTPLHIIQGNLEGVLDGVYDASPAHIEATLDETRLLARLVEDLRTLSLAEAGQLPLHLEEVDLCELLADARTSFSGQAEAKGVTLLATYQGVDVEETTHPPCPAVRADLGRLDQILGNLLSNAIRHTPEGGTIALRASSIEQGTRIEVSDTGEGIPAEDLPYIFDRFWRGDPSRSHASGGGTGLGLAITRQLVRAHGGRIYVESRPGQGTTFTVELPAD
jgi:signal transduction histidine kinase